MLLEFKTKNYKLFSDEMVFSMTAAPKQKGLDYSLHEKKSGRKKIRGLSSSVIYGPNAAGKTNIIGAMEVFKSIIIRGNINNTNTASSPNIASSRLELIPNSKHVSPRPVEFYIDFIEDETRVQYALTLDLGVFLDTDYNRKIISETLVVNEKPIFSRNDKFTVENLDSIKKHLLIQNQNDITNIAKIAQNSLSDDELFLTNGFKSIFSQSLIKLITNWFLEKFIIIYRADSLHLYAETFSDNKSSFVLDKATNSAAKIFGAKSNAIGYIGGDDNNDPSLCTLIKTAKDENLTVLPAEVFESYGTVRVINIFPLIFRAITTGGVIVIDEFDASIHPSALMSIVNIFHNDDINKNGAQLIFNTHNPIFLNKNIFRRDEIKFVERDDSANNSTVYSLSDFGTSGKSGVRKHEDYMKNYFISQYGAISDIDFTPIFDELSDDKSEV